MRGAALMCYASWRERGPLAAVDARNRRIGLQVTSSCFPRWDRNPNTGHPFGADAGLRVAHQEILHDRGHPSHVVLPMVGSA
jgi:uncharacterized protein